MVGIYYGGYGIVKKSGVGKAITHQESILKQMHLFAKKEDRKEAEIIQINTVFPDSVIEAIRAKRRGQRVIYYAHSTEEDFRNSFPGSNLCSPLFKKWILFCYNLGDIIITPSNYSKRLLEGYGITKPIYAVSNGIDTTFWAPDEKKRAEFHQKMHVASEQKIVISVGHLIERKGIMEFMEMARNMPDVLFLWYGHTPSGLMRENVKEALLHLPENVRMMGYVSSEELREAYQGCDAFLFLSKEETEGIVVLEAMACGTRVIVNDIPVFSDWLEDKKTVVKIKSGERADDVLKDVLSTHNSAMRLQARRFAESRSYKQIERQMRQIYDMEMISAVPATEF